MSRAIKITYPPSQNHFVEIAKHSTLALFAMKEKLKDLLCLNSGCLIIPDT